MIEESDRQRIRHERTQARKKRREKKKRKPSHVCALQVQPCSPAARASMPGEGLSVWLAGNGWLAMALLGRACGNTCETAIIMAFLSECGGCGGRSVPLPLYMSRRKHSAVTIFNRAFYLVNSTAVLILLSSRVWVRVQASVCRPRRSTSEMPPAHTHSLFHSFPGLPFPWQMQLI